MTFAQEVSYTENIAQKTLFNNRTTYNSTSSYSRIPAITKMSDGTLIAFSDVRIGGGNDIGGGNHISIVARKSTDNGATWGTQYTVVEGLGSGFDYAHGDAAVVTDRESGKMILLCASGTTGYGSGGCLLGQYTSTDGTTWTGGEITSKIKSAFTTAKLSVSKQFFTSGRIIQSSKIKVGSSYRIYSALCTGSGSIVMYSDDFGGNWAVLGNKVAYSGGDETVLEELPNGDLLLSARLSGSSRGFNVFKYSSLSSGSGSWNSSTATGLSQATNCNGEMLLLPTTKSNIYVLLHSVSLSGRTNVTVYYKIINTDTDNYTTSSYYSSNWQTLKQMSTTTSCYSTMVQDKDGNVAFLFEENSNGGYDIQYRNFSVNCSYGYKVNCAEVGGGVVTATPNKDLNGGETIHLSNTPSAGYTFKGYSVTDATGNSVAVKADGTFIMPQSNVTVTGQFALEMGTAPAYAMQVSGSTLYLDMEKTISGSDGNQGVTMQGTAYPVEITEATGTDKYTIKALGSISSYLVPGKRLIGWGWSVTTDATSYSWTFATTSNSTYTIAREVGKYIGYDSLSEGAGFYHDKTNPAQFVLLPMYATTIGAVSNGNVTCNAPYNYSLPGTEIRLSAVPNVGYALSAYNVVDDNGNSVSVTDGAFVMPASNVTITATFVKDSDMPKSYEYIVDAQNGIFGHDACSNTGSAYYCKWTSNRTSPLQLTLNCLYADKNGSVNSHINNMLSNSDNTSFVAYSANNNSSTYTADYQFTIDNDDYVIVSYSFDYTPDTSNTPTVKDNNGDVYASGTTVSVNANTCKFSLVGKSSSIGFVTISNLKVVVAPKSDSFSISEYEWGTFFVNAPFEMPEGVEGYIATVENNKMKLVDTYKAGDIVPANTPLLLNGAEGTYSYSYVKSDAAAPAGNYLRGMLTKGNIKAESAGSYYYYKLTTGTDPNTANYGKIGFYWGEQNGGVFKINHNNRAYLVLPQSISPAKGYAFEGETDGVANIETETADSAIYNLAGQRVGKSYRGIVVKNGKKFIVK